MAIWNRKKSDESTPPATAYAAEEKGDYGHDTKDYNQATGDHVAAIETAADSETKLHRGLKARHITMIAIGGAIGTGLIIGTGAALAKAGPASILISYTFVGIIVFLVMAALGEMAAWLPMGEGFAGYATRFCDPALGFALGYVSILLESGLSANTNSL
jgi:amino acid transporter